MLCLHQHKDEIKSSTGIVINLTKPKERLHRSICCCHYTNKVESILTILIEAEKSKAPICINNMTALPRDNGTSGRQQSRLVVSMNSEPRDKEGSQFIKNSKMIPSSNSSLLPPEWELTPNSVVVGRCKPTSSTATSITGNERLRVICKTFLNKYSNPNTSKNEKTSIVSRIVDMIQEVNYPNRGAFVKLVDGRWREVYGHGAREKVGSVMRDLNSGNYKSSSKARSERRRIKRREQQQQQQQKKNKELHQELGMGQQQQQQQQEQEQQKVNINIECDPIPELDRSSSLNILLQQYAQNTKEIHLPSTLDNYGVINAPGLSQSTIDFLMGDVYKLQQPYHPQYNSALTDESHTSDFLYNGPNLIAQQHHQQCANIDDYQIIHGKGQEGMGFHPVEDDYDVLGSHNQHRRGSLDFIGHI